MRTSRTLLVPAILAVGALLAACSGDPAPGTTTPAPSASTPTSAAPVDATLTVWVDENRKPAVESAAKAYTDATGVKIETVVKNFEDIRADFIAQVGTGEGPDITIGAHDWLGALVENGVVAPVDFADKKGDFIGVAVDAVTWDGQTYGLPYAMETVAVVRNTELVDSTPKTFDEMIAKAREAKVTYPLTINTNGTTGDGYTYYALQTSFGAPVFVQNDDGSYSTKVGMGGENGAKFAEWLGANGMAGDKIFSTDFTYDVANQEFADGKAAYTIAGPWAIATLTGNGVKVAVDPIPSAGGETAAPFVGVQTFYVSSASKNAILANDFLVNYVATDEGVTALQEADPRLPALRVVADRYASDANIAGFLAQAEVGVPMPAIAEMGDVWDLWNAASSDIIAGKAKDPAARWATMVTDLEAKLG